MTILKNTTTWQHPEAKNNRAGLPGADPHARRQPARQAGGLKKSPAIVGAIAALVLIAPTKASEPSTEVSRLISCGAAYKAMGINWRASRMLDRVEEQGVDRIDAKVAAEVLADAMRSVGSRQRQTAFSQGRATASRNNCRRIR